jgi:hypothetical protein
MDAVAAIARQESINNIGHHRHTRSSAVKALNRFSLTLIATLIAITEAAYGTQPPDVVNSDSNNNTAMGTDALEFLSGGSGSNTAAGYSALVNDTTGSYNTAVGSLALGANTTGPQHDWQPEYGLWCTKRSITTRPATTTLPPGTRRSYANTTGNYNNASGYFALHNNSSGAQNSASGVQALYGNKTGNYNTASGTDALFSNTTGSTNIAEGYKAGYNLTTGSNNIDIGNLGVAAESGTIRIGTTSTQTKTYIAGIYGTSVTGSAVVVSSTGQLGVTVSSERYKTALRRWARNKAEAAAAATRHASSQDDPTGCAAVRPHRRGSGEGVPGAGDPR